MPNNLFVKIFPTGFKFLPTQIDIIVPILVSAAVFLICLVQLNFRGEHYQEHDSYHSYHLMKNSINEIPGYLSISYGSSSKILDVDAEYIMNVAPDYMYLMFEGGAIKDRLRQKLRILDKEKTFKELVSIAVEQGVIPKAINIHALLRTMQSNVIDTSQMPETLKRALIYPLASTFSFGPGLIYSALFNISDDYKEFKDNALLVTVTFFYLTCIFLYAGCRCIDLSSAVSAIVTLWYALSISNSSYAFHLGSYGWNTGIVTTLLCLTLFAVKIKQPIVAYYFSAAGIAFSYMALLVFLPLLVSLGFVSNRMFPGVHRPSKLQLLLPLIFVFAYLLAFAQPGQGVKSGATDLLVGLEYFYYILLNIFAVVNIGGIYTKSLQFLLPFILIFIALSNWIRNEQALRSGFGIQIMIIVSYALFWTFGLLNPIPSRHTLFLSGPLFILVGVGISSAISKVKNKSVVLALYGVFFVSICCSLIFISTRHEQMRDLYPSEFSTSSVIWAPETGTPLVWLYSNSGRSIKGRDVLDDGSEYIYVSQTRPLEEFLGRCARIKTDNCPSSTIGLKVESIIRRSTQYSYLAYPYMPDSEKFLFNATKKLFITKFSFMGSSGSGGLPPQVRLPSPIK